MYSWLFTTDSFFSQIELRHYIGMIPSEYNGLLNGAPLSQFCYPEDHHLVAIDGCERYTPFLVKNDHGEAVVGELFEYSIVKNTLRGPLFYFDNSKDGFKGIAGDYAFFDSETSKCSLRVSLTDGSVMELADEYGFPFGCIAGDILMRGGTHKVRVLARLCVDGEPRWKISLRNVREVMYFSPQELIVCAVWHPRPDSSYCCTRCDVMLIDAGTGITIDTIHLDELLAERKGQIVIDGDTLFVRSHKALYCYNLCSRENRRFPLPDVMSSHAFLVAEGKAYFADNEEGGARVYVVSGNDGQMIGTRFLEGLKLNNMSSRISRFDDGYAMTLDNATELPGWHYQRAIGWRDGEMEDPDAEIIAEPMRVGIVRELAGRESRYRVRMGEPRPFEEVLRQMSIGIESAAYQAAMDVYDDTKDYDTDFAGELIADFSNQSLTEEDKRLLDTRLQRMSRIELAQFRSAVDNEKLTVKTVYE